MKILLFCATVSALIGCGSKEKAFELCDEGDLRPYYYPALRYEGAFYVIKTHFNTGYKEIKAPNNTGIVKIRFHVNCKGETGNYKVETYGLKDYKTIEMDSQISQQLVTLTKELKNWIPAKNEDGELVNSHKFFAFRIRDGQIIDILPK